MNRFDALADELGGFETLAQKPAAEAPKVTTASTSGEILLRFQLVDGVAQFLTMSKSGMSFQWSASPGGEILGPCVLTISRPGTP